MVAVQLPQCHVIYLLFNFVFAAIFDPARHPRSVRAFRKSVLRVVPWRHLGLTSQAARQGPAEGRDEGCEEN